MTMFPLKSSVDYPRNVYPRDTHLLEAGEGKCVRLKMTVVGQFDLKT